MVVDKLDTATIHFFRKKGRGRPKTRIGTTKDHNREGQAKFRKERTAKGFKQATVWLSAAAQVIVADYRRDTVLTKDQTINELIELVYQYQENERKAARAAAVDSD